MTVFGAGVEGVAAEGLTCIVVSSRSAAPRDSVNVPYQPRFASNGIVRSAPRMVEGGGIMDEEGFCASLGRIEASIVKASTMCCAGYQNL